MAVLVRFMRFVLFTLSLGHGPDDEWIILCLSEPTRPLTDKITQKSQMAICNCAGRDLRLSACEQELFRLEVSRRIDTTEEGYVIVSKLVGERSRVLDVIGYIRFSHPAKSDVKLQRITEPEDYEEKLWCPQRMACRFYCFEQFCLPSLSAQTNQHFRICVLASNRMPESFKDKLQHLCSSVPQISLHFDDLNGEEGNVHSLFRRWYEQNIHVKLGHTLHFRMDDDDALSNKFIEKCHYYGRRLVPGEALTFPNGFVAGVYEDKPVIIDLYEPYIGLGLGVVKDSADLNCSPFSGPPHLSTGRSVTAISVPMRGAYIYVFHQGSDTLIRQPKNFKAFIARDAGFGQAGNAAEKQRLLSKNYPFLADGKLEDLLRNMPRPAESKLV